MLLLSITLCSMILREKDRTSRLVSDLKKKMKYIDVREKTKYPVCQQKIT